MSDARTQLMARLQVLESLNPDLAQISRPELLALATAAGPAAFDEVAALGLRLVARYTTSPWKQSERALITEFFLALAATTRRLVAAGEVAKTEPAREHDSSVALVDRRLYSSGEWCRVQAAAGLPKKMLLAVDAARNRNRLLGPLLEPLFAVLHTLDPARAVAWELEFLDAQRGDLDPDVVRDLLLCWLEQDTLPPAALEWALQWSADENLERQWPAVTEKADALLRRHALRAWCAASRSRRASVQHLQALARRGALGVEPLTVWLNASLADIGESAQFFIALSEAMNRDDRPGAGAWAPAALSREVETLTVLYVPVLLMADMLLFVPGGAFRFALTFFGLGQRGMALWRQRLEGLAAKNVRRMFLLGLRAGTPSLDVIRRLCFGDALLLSQLERELDFGTKEFDSLKQREKVTDRLAVNYVSIREPALLGTEISRRYRCLMRVMHEDSLGRLLRPEDLARVRGEWALADIMAVAAEARRYIAQRRDLAMPLADLVATEMDFAREIRQRRQRLLRRLLRLA